MNTSKLYRTLSVVIIFLFINLGAICQTFKAKIEYKSFTVTALQKKIMINWVIGNNDSANYFEIQKSFDGKDFKTVALVMGPDPKQRGGDSYEGCDKFNPNTKKYFYRLKHVSTDGEIEMSETKMLALY